MVKITAIRDMLDAFTEDVGGLGWSPSGEQQQDVGAEQLGARLPWIVVGSTGEVTVGRDEGWGWTGDCWKVTPIRGIGSAALNVSPNLGGG